MQHDFASDSVDALRLISMQIIAICEMKLRFKIQIHFMVFVIS